MKNANCLVSSSKFYFLQIQMAVREFLFFSFPIPGFAFFAAKFNRK